MRCRAASICISIAEAGHRNDGAAIRHIAEIHVHEDGGLDIHSLRRNQDHRILRRAARRTLRGSKLMVKVAGATPEPRFTEIGGLPAVGVWANY